MDKGAGGSLFSTELQTQTSNIDQTERQLRLMFSQAL